MKDNTPNADINSLPIFNLTTESIRQYFRGRSHAQLQEVLLRPCRGVRRKVALNAIGRLRDEGFLDLIATDQGIVVVRGQR